MLINKTQLSAVSFTSKDKYRTKLQRLWFIPDESAVEATDGHKLVRVVNRSDKAERINSGGSGYDPDRESFGINKDVLKTLQTVIKKDDSANLTYNGNGSVHCELNSKFIGFKELELEVEPGAWPDTKSVMPDNHGVKFAFDARYMKEICELLIKAQGNSRAMVRAEMRLSETNPQDRAFYITNGIGGDNKIEIALMPVRL